MKLERSSQTPVQVTCTTRRRLNPAQSGCPAGHTAEGSPKGQTSVCFGMVPPHVFSLHNVPCTCSPRISPVLLKTLINRDTFYLQYNPKYQTGCKPLLEWQNHLLDRRWLRKDKATALHASFGPVPDQHFTVWGAGLFLPPQILTHHPPALTPSYLRGLSATAFALRPLCWEWGRWARRAASHLTRGTSHTFTHQQALFARATNSDEKSSQRFHRMREHGVLKCLATVKIKKKKTAEKKEIHNLHCKIEYLSMLYFNNFQYIYLKRWKDALLKSYMSALIITSCAKSKPSPGLLA